MPTIDVSDDELAALTAYIKSAGATGTAAPAPVQTVQGVQQ
jgi:hypothetical protein